MNTISALYEYDFYAWLVKQAEFIRQGRLTELDREHLAEELETMGRSEKRELSSRLAVLMAHLLKWTLQPQQRSSSWFDTIVEQRFQLLHVIQDSPSLKHELPEKIAQAYSSAVSIAAKETKLPITFFPPTCPYSSEQLFDENFLGE